MKKIILSLICLVPISLFAQHLDLDDLFYLYEHNKTECDTYLNSRNYQAEPPDDFRFENGCDNNTWTPRDLNKPYELIAKQCDDGFKGNVRYATFSREVYDELLQEYKDFGFSHLDNIEDSDGNDVVLYKWFNCIGYFSVMSSEMGPLYIIGLEHFRDKE